MSKTKILRSGIWNTNHLTWFALLVACRNAAWMSPTKPRIWDLLAWSADHPDKMARSWMRRPTAEAGRQSVFGMYSLGVKSLTDMPLGKDRSAIGRPSVDVTSPFLGTTPYGLMCIRTLGFVSQSLRIESGRTNSEPSSWPPRTNFARASIPV